MADNEISGTENANGVPQLKPCPFCGGDDVNFVRAKLVFDNTIGYMPLCADCGCAVGGNIDTEFTAYTDFHTEAEAIGAWNTRAERTCHVVPHGYCIANGEESSCRCWSCSECSYGWHVSDYDRQYRYCPNCGAKVVE